MDINCCLITNGESEGATISEKLLIELCKNLRNKGIATVHFADRSIQVEGVYIPAKGCKNTLIVLSNKDIKVTV